MDNDFSNEGLYRLLEKMDREHGEDLKEIRRQTTATNGRLIKLETRVDRGDQELKRLNSAVFKRPDPTDTSAAKVGESLSIRMSPKIWTALAAAGGVLFAMAVETLKNWLARS